MFFNKFKDNIWDKSKNITIHLIKNPKTSKSYRDIMPIGFLREKFRDEI